VLEFLVISFGKKIYIAHTYKSKVEIWAMCYVYE
jgi:hypothetical protein